jgi:RNA polymerase sigma-70 factor (ECF subfamily)
MYRSGPVRDTAAEAPVSISTDAKVMPEADPSPELIRRIRDGDAGGADELFAQYARRLTRVAEVHLSRRLSGRLNGEDVVQSVFRTFFRRSSEGEFRIDGSAQLWRLLVKITLRKARAKGRHHTAAIRDVGTEALEDGDRWLAEAAAREPGPLEAALLTDQIESLLRGLPELSCHVLDLRLQGHKSSEIASRLGVSRQTVYRTLGLLRDRLEADSRKWS